MKKIFIALTDLFKGSCPRCGDYYDGDVCQHVVILGVN